MASIQAVIVDPDGTVRTTEIETDLGAYQAVVGGYIEGVFSVEVTIYVNEEGLLMGLPFNPTATMFANDVLGYLGMRLFGTALILGPSDGEGNDTSVRPNVADYFTKGN